MNVMRALAIAGLAAGALAPPAAAATTVSGTHVRFAALAVGPHGRTAVAWERLRAGRYAIEARVGGSPRRLSRVRLLAARGSSPRTAVGSDGTAAVEWTQTIAGRRDELRVAVARPGHGFGRAQVVERRRANLAPVGVAVQPGRRVVAVWSRNRNALGFALARRGHGFGRPQTVSAIKPNSDSSLAVDPRDGAAVVAYNAPPAAAGSAAVRVLPATGMGFAAPVVVSTPDATGRNETYPVAITGSAGAGVAYTQVGDPYTLHLARRAADGSWGAAELIALAGYGDGVFPEHVQATSPVGGSALAAWSVVADTPNGMGSAIASATVVSRAAPAGPFGAPEALTPGGRHFGAPAVASAGGTAFVATAEPGGPVVLATVAPGGTRLQALTPRGDGDVLLAAAGPHVLAAYQRGDRLLVSTVR